MYSTLVRMLLAENDRYSFQTGVRIKEISVAHKFRKWKGRLA